MGDLNERRTGREQGRGIVPDVSEELLKCKVWGVSSRDPEDLGRRATLLNQCNEIGILRDDCDSGVTSGIENGTIACVQEAELPHVDGLHTERGRQPLRQLRGKLRVNPDNHAASVGWSRRRLA